MSSDTLNAIREKYPQYDSTSDEDLVFAIGNKYPQYLSSDSDFKKEFSAAKTQFEQALKPTSSRRAELGQPFAEVQPSGEVIQRTLGNDPERNREELNKAFTPLINPQPSAEDLAFRKAHPVVGGVEAGIVELAKGFTSPVGIATLGIGTLPKAIQKAVSIAFAAQMSKQVPEIATQLGTEFGKPEEQRDKQKIAQLITEGAGTVGFTALAAKHGMTPEPAAKIQGPIATGEVLQTPKGAKPPSLTPLTDEALKQTTGKAAAAPETPPASQSPEPAMPDIQNIRPAIKTMDGNILVGDKGDVHDDIISKNHLQPENIDSRLFVDEKGNEISREQLSAMGVKSDKPVEGAHASDLAKAQESQPVSEKTPAEGVAAVSDTPTPAVSKVAPVVFKGVQKGAKGIPDMEYYDLTEDIPDHPKGSTIGRKELESMGYTIPDAATENPATVKPEGNPTAMKYKLIDEERQQRGLPALTKGEAVGDQATMDKAMGEMDKNPELANNLIKELNGKPRAIDAWERMVLLLRKIDLRNQFQKASDEAVKAADEKSPDLQNKQLQVAQLSDRLTELEKASRVSGSEQGRGLRSLRIMANEDMSLASLETQRRIAKGGEPLTPDERASLSELADAYKKADEQLQNHLEGKQPIPSNVIDLATRIVSSLDRGADAARERIKKRAQTLFANPLDPIVLLDVAQIGASHLAHIGLDFAKWSAKMVEEFGEKVKPYLDDIFKRSQGILEGINASDEVKRIITRKPNGSKVVADAIAKVYGEESKSVAKDVVSDLKKNPVASERQRVADAAAKTAIDAAENDLKAAKEELEASKVQGKAAKDAQDAASKTIREAATQRANEETKQRVADVKRAKETAAIQDRAKRVAQAAIDKTAREEATKKAKQESQKRMDDARRAKETARIQEKAANKAKQAAQKRVTKAAIQSAKVARKSLVTPGVPAWKKAILNLQSLKTRTAKQITDLESKIAKGDYSTTPKPEPLMDREAMELQAKRDRIVGLFRAGQERLRLANRKSWEKALDFASDFKRFSVLSSVKVIPKLVSAGIQRLTTMPLEELIGSAWRKAPIISKVAAKAPLEGGGFNLSAEMKGFGAAFTQGMRDAYNILKTGRSDLDVLYGKGNASYSGETSAGTAFLEVPGRIHGMIKAPVKRAAFERAVQILGEFYAKQGLDVTDPLVKTRIATEAYKAANRSIFLEDNRVVSAYKAGLSRLEGKDATIGIKAAATALKIALPIVRVPTNIAVETMRYSLGAIKAPVRIAFALSKGMENLKPEEADAIMRDLKKGSIGAAVLLLGYYNADNIGGYYQPNKKQKQGDVKYGSVRIFGEDIPAYLLHNPLLETLQVGATVRKVAESKLRKKDSEAQGLAWGTVSAALGVAEETPFGREIVDLSKVFDPYQRKKWAQQQLKDQLVPKVVQQGYEGATNLLNHAP